MKTLISFYIILDLVMNTNSLVQVFSLLQLILALAFKSVEIVVKILGFLARSISRIKLLVIMAGPVEV